MFRHFVLSLFFSLHVCFLHAHGELLLPEFTSELIDDVEFDKHPFWSRALEQSLFYAEEDFKNDIAYPEWALGDSEKVRNYYALHQEGRIDRMFGYLASKLGVMIHGDITQEQLAERLQNFDIQKLLHEGPYPHPNLSLAAQELIFNSLHGVARVVDVHLHNLGYDEGNYLNPKAAAFGVAEWKDYFTFLLLRYASGMSSPLGSTQQARHRIHLYASHFPKLCGCILPIHQAILPNGSSQWENTGNYLTDSAALSTAKNFNSVNSHLIPAVSVHPFDPLWKQKLEEAHAKGIRLVKWMPPQSIPPDADALDSYYAKMKELNMVLIAHSGPEHAIPTHEHNQHWQDWGNPLRFRKPLQAGVTVILAHCGHKDLIPDLDHPELQAVPGYELFLRLARESYQERWPGKLYGDLAAVTTHYGPDFIAAIMEHANEKGIRIIYGSDYPYTNLIKPKNDAYDICTEAGLLDPEKVVPLKEIRALNPPLANYVFTKNLVLPKLFGESIRFPDATFTLDFDDGPLQLVNWSQWEQFKASTRDSNATSK